jgi:hypothetical protein
LSDKLQYVLCFASFFGLLLKIPPLNPLQRRGLYSSHFLQFARVMNFGIGTKGVNRPLGARGEAVPSLRGKRPFIHTDTLYPTCFPFAEVSNLNLHAFLPTCTICLALWSFGEVRGGICRECSLSIESLGVGEHDHEASMFGNSMDCL